MGLFNFFLRSRERKDARPRIERGFRGEGIQYENAGRQLEIDFTWCNGDRLYTETIDRWCAGEPLSDEEKEAVFSDVLAYLSRPLRRTIVVINTDDPSEPLWEALSKKNSRLIKEIEYDSIDKQREFERQMYLGDLKRQGSLIINDQEITSTEELDNFLTQLRKSK